MVIHPSKDFDWTQVSWGGPDEPVSETCSYCDAPLGDEYEPDYEVPLIIWNKGGWCARFCIECQRTYWGVEP